MSDRGIIAWVKYLFLAVFLSFGLSLTFIGACVKAVDFGDFYYYGPVINSYSQYNGSGKKTYMYPEGVFCFQMKLFDKQYICIACPWNMLVNDGSNVWGLYRQYTQFDLSGSYVSSVNNNFFQMEGYASDLIVSVDGVDFIVRSMEITDNIVDCPYFMAYTNRSDGAKSALLGYVNGVKSFTFGGEINGNISVDLSNIEQSLETLEQSNLISANNSESIKLKMDELDVNIQPDDDLNNDVSDIRKFVVLLFLLSGFTYFGNRLRSWRNYAIGVKKS